MEFGHAAQLMETNKTSAIKCYSLSRQGRLLSCGLRMSFPSILSKLSFIRSWYESVSFPFFRLTLGSVLLPSLIYSHLLLFCYVPFNFRGYCTGPVITVGAEIKKTGHKSRSRSGNGQFEVCFVINLLIYDKSNEPWCFGFYCQHISSSIYS